MRQPSIYPRNVTQRIDTDPREHVITQGQMYPQTFNQPVMFDQDNRVDPRPLYSPYTVLGAGTSPQLTSSKSVNPGMIRYPSGVPQQQIMGMSSNTSRGRMVPTNRGAPHIGVADNTSSRSVLFQFPSINNPNNVSLYNHPTNSAAVSVHHSPPSPKFKFLDLNFVSFTTYCTVIPYNKKLARQKTFTSSPCPVC